ncbi:MAG: hypothetical protein EA398_07015 [Deltaproteobacteria bacterium]|nr:MAG: hypothetical protein EA398_07015 [Deltaproteobacteria bacterium]
MYPIVSDDRPTMASASPSRRPGRGALLVALVSAVFLILGAMACGGSQASPEAAGPDTDGVDREVHEVAPSPEVVDPAAPGEQPPMGVPDEEPPPLPDPEPMPQPGDPEPVGPDEPEPPEDDPIQRR